MKKEKLLKGTPYTVAQAELIKTWLVGLKDSVKAQICVAPSPAWNDVRFTDARLQIGPRAYVRVYDLRQANNLYGLLNGTDFLGQKPMELPTEHKNCQSNAVSAGSHVSSYVINYKPGALTPIHTPGTVYGAKMRWPIGPEKIPHVCSAKVFYSRRQTAG